MYYHLHRHGVANEDKLITYYPILIAGLEALRLPICAELPLHETLQSSRCSQSPSSANDASPPQSSASGKPQHWLSVLAPAVPASRNNFLGAFPMHLAEVGCRERVIFKYRVAACWSVVESNTMIGRSGWHLWGGF